MMVSLPRKHIGKSVYGAILTATLLITLEDYEDSAWDMVITIVLTLFAVAVSEYYATVIAMGFEKETNLKRERAINALSDCLYMFYGSLFPVFIFVVAGFGWLRLPTAFNIAELAVAVLLVVYGYLFGRARGHGRPKSMIYGFANFGIVASIVALKSIFH
jgi:hypothetical protein